MASAKVDFPASDAGQQDGPDPVRANRVKSGRPGVQTHNVRKPVSLLLIQLGSSVKYLNKAILHTPDSLAGSYKNQPFLSNCEAKRYCTCHTEYRQQ